LIALAGFLAPICFALLLGGAAGGYETLIRLSPSAWMSERRCLLGALAISQLFFQTEKRGDANFAMLANEKVQRFLAPRAQIKMVMDYLIVILVGCFCAFHALKYVLTVVILGLIYVLTVGLVLKCCGSCCLFRLRFVLLRYWSLWSWRWFTENLGLWFFVMLPCLLSL